MHPILPMTLALVLLAGTATAADIGQTLLPPPEESKDEPNLTVPPAPEEETYAERLGWPHGAKVVIFHVADAGMSYDSNRGAIRAMEEGLATEGFELEEAAPEKE